MLEFKRRELALKVYGEEYKILFPTVSQVQNYAKELNKRGEEDAGELLLEFLDKLGLPKEVSGEMESDHLQQVVNALMPAKKK